MLGGRFTNQKNDGQFGVGVWEEGFLDKQQSIFDVEKLG